MSPLWGFNKQPDLKLLIFRPAGANDIGRLLIEADSRFYENRQMSQVN